MWVWSNLRSCWSEKPVLARCQSRSTFVDIQTFPPIVVKTQIANAWETSKAISTCRMTTNLFCLTFILTMMKYSFTSYEAEEYFTILLACFHHLSYILTIFVNAMKSFSAYTSITAFRVDAFLSKISNDDSNVWLIEWSGWKLASITGRQGSLE